MRVAIVDYGMGNINSLKGALMQIGVEDIILSDDLKELRSSDRIILPGVGSFSAAMKKIRLNNLDKTLSILAFTEKKPILGICLGMQIMCSSSVEGGHADGLQFVNGMLEKFNSENHRVPHVGFNQVQYNPDSILFSGFKGNPDFYFTHSYCLKNSSECLKSFTHYGENFISAFEVDNIFGVQFHPELSQNNGLRLLNNFVCHAQKTDNIQPNIF